MSATTGKVYEGGPSAIQTIIPSYLYTQYADDDDLQAFVAAFNGQAQEFLNWFNVINLPIYTGGIVAGPLLDWVGQGLYGMVRPALQNSTTGMAGPINSYAINAVVINGQAVAGMASYTPATDDVYRRCLTWNFYKGDGMVFSLQWLKRRLVRFLFGANGISPVIDNTYAVSVTCSGRTLTITLPAGAISTILQIAINSGILALPFQYFYVVNI